LVQTTIKGMKRIAEIKKRREYVFWKNRWVDLDHFPTSVPVLIGLTPPRMVAAKEKVRAHRRKALANKETVSTKLLEPVTAAASPIREKIKVKSSTRSALIPGEGQSMGMAID
jgi:large subunit ribosomal protein L24e